MEEVEVCEVPQPEHIPEDDDDSDECSPMKKETAETVALVRKNHSLYTALICFMWCCIAFYNVQIYESNTCLLTGNMKTKFD